MIVGRSPVREMLRRRWRGGRRWACGLAVLAAAVACRPAEDGPGPAAAPLPVVSASGVPMVALPGGAFVMGSDRGEADERPAHPVRLTPFLMDQFEVTHAQFTQAQLPNPSKWQEDPQGPVNQVRWQDARRYCNERSLLEGLEPVYDEAQPGWPADFSRNGYRLPTEAEWEYAARAGSRGDYGPLTEAQLPRQAVFAGNSGGRARRVETGGPNPWGLYGLYGNVSEWCHDVYDPAYYAASPGEDPAGPEGEGADPRRVVRGGSWKATASLCRVAFRRGERTGNTDACFASDDCGFRCVRRATPEEVERLQAGQPAGPAAP